jgi:hypothetical protein
MMSTTNLEHGTFWYNGLSVPRKLCSCMHVAIECPWTFWVVGSFLSASALSPFWHVREVKVIHKMCLLARLAECKNTESPYRCSYRQTFGILLKCGHIPLLKPHSRKGHFLRKSTYISAGARDYLRINRRERVWTELWINKIVALEACVLFWRFGVRDKVVKRLRGFLSASTFSRFCFLR